MKKIDEQELTVFDLSSSAEQGSALKEAVCTYEIIDSASETADREHPFMILSDPDQTLKPHQNGNFLNPHRRTSFEYKTSAGTARADILAIDRRFIHLLEYLGGERKNVRLHGVPDGMGGYAVYRILAVDPSGMTTIRTDEDPFLQLMIRRLLASHPDPHAENDADSETESEENTSMVSLSEVEQYLFVAGNTLPATVRTWAERNVAILKNNSVSLEERRHALRALIMMMNIQWKGSYFPSIDPVEARAILDEELYGMEEVKQRIIETVIQVNRTHTLPAYGILLAGPAGIGKSQVAYAVARILKLPWISLDMSAIHDAEALTGSPRVYSNAKPGRIMEGFAQAGSSNLVFIINELDKADVTSPNGNPADSLLTLLDNLGFTDNYIECKIPTDGVYPVATANDKSKISAPLMSRFAVIDIPDYTPEEKKMIFKKFSLPKVLKRMGMEEEECRVDDGALDKIILAYHNESGVRGLEQAAEHLAAHALYLIETQGIRSVCYHESDIDSLLGKA